MVKRKYALAVVLCLLAIFAVDFIAKFGHLGGWSAAFDVAANLVLIALAVTAFVFGIRADRRAQAESEDNDY